MADKLSRRTVTATASRSRSTVVTTTSSRSHWSMFTDIAQMSCCGHGGFGMDRSPVRRHRNAPIRRRIVLWRCHDIQFLISPSPKSGREVRFLPGFQLTVGDEVTVFSRSENRYRFKCSRCPRRLAYRCGRLAHRSRPRRRAGCADQDCRYKSPGPTPMRCRPCRSSHRGLRHRRQSRPVARGGPDCN